jgi:lysyl-tRNA synthetase class I
MPIMGVQVIPAPHGKATSYVTDAMEAHVDGFDKAGGEVGLVCSDSTYVHKVGSPFALLAAPENDHIELPVHMQGWIRKEEHHT